MKVLIVGAGRVGRAVAQLVKPLGLEVHVADVREDVDLPHFHQVTSDNSIDAIIQAVKPFAVFVCTHFKLNVSIATSCAIHSAHYIDFTEDVQTTNALKEMPTGRTTRVLQCGLAPGFINGLGLTLLSRLHPDEARNGSLALRVGALPRSTRAAANYCITWSPEGLVNEYLRPAQALHFGARTEVPSLSGREKLLIDGTQYEAFVTSGGLGDISIWEKMGLMSVDYKSIRYPGHLKFLRRNLIPESGLTEQQLAGLPDLFKNAFPSTLNDVVVIGAFLYTHPAVAITEHSITLTVHGQGGLTALELTTASHGVAILNHLMKGGFGEPGVYFGGEVPVHELAYLPWAQQALLDNQPPK